VKQSPPRATGWALVAAVLALSAPHALPLSSLRRCAYDPQDSAIFLWNFWWTKTALSEGRTPLFTDRLLHPEGASLAFHTFPLPYSLASLPAQLLLPGPDGLVVALNLVILGSFLLAALGAYRLAWHVTGSGTGAVAAGLLYALTPFRFLNTARLHLLGTEVLPFATLAWIRLLEEPSRGRALGVGAWLALAFYTSQEYALFLCLLFALSLIPRLGARAAPRAGPIALAALAFLALASPLLARQAVDWRSGRVEPARSMEEIDKWRPAARSFVVPSRQHPVWGGAFAAAGEYGDGRTLGMRSETSVGLATWVLALVGFVAGRRGGARMWAAAALVFLVLALGPALRLTGSWDTGLPLPYRALVAALPPLRASRDTTRFFPLALLCLAVLAAFGARALRARGPWSGRAALALLALCAAEGLARPGEAVPAGRLVPAAYAALAGGSGAVLDLSPDLDAVLAQTVHGRPVTSGRLAVPRAAPAVPIRAVEAALRRPRAVLALPEAERDEVAAALGAELRALFRHVVLPAGDAAAIRLALLLGAVRVDPPPGSGAESTGPAVLAIP
jgi:hypothetical protein